MLNIVLFGPPGAGKGTLAAKLVAQKNLIHLSTGDLLRDEIKRQTPVGIEVARLIDKGNLASDEMVIKMVRDFVKTHMPCTGFIFDGFPRTTAQAKELDKILAEQGTTVAMMVALDVSEEETIRRMQKRAHTEGRADDADITIIRNRITTYHKKTETTIEYYKTQGKYYSIDSSISPEYTLNEITKIFTNIQKQA